jgi:hypothetical protein
VNLPHKSVYVILRLDSGMSELSNAVAVTKVFESEDAAAAEAERLNAVNAARGAKYEMRVSRLVVV